jgi:hypothetical protein
MSESVCLVTVHGIGFQQPPDHGRPGYADALHAALREQLKDRLGDDPERTPSAGPVYIRSELNGSPRDGLARLDPDRPLAAEGKVAHVALVYSPSEALVARPGSVADTLARTVISHSHYTSALGAIRLLLADAWAAIREQQPVGPESTLRTRDDLDVPHHAGVIQRLLHIHARSAQSASPGASSSTPSAFGTIRALEDDVAAYVSRNDLRERVRGFVEAALLKLSDRRDIEALVVNSHSQGTVICWDVLCNLPFQSWSASTDPRARLLRSFVTAGSPIRKYIDLFAWGEEVGQLAALTIPDHSSFSWQNYWDPHDPVADPLNEPASWRPDDSSAGAPSDDIGLLVARDQDGTRHHVTVTDRQLDNISNSSGGGLQAHDYWNNKAQFVSSLASLVAGLMDTAH